MRRGQCTGGFQVGRKHYPCVHYYTGEPCPSEPEILTLDPRWDWIEVPTIGDREPRYVQGQCNHLDIIPIRDVSGELVARLCLTCDQQWTIPLEVRWT